MSGSSTLIQDIKYKVDNGVLGYGLRLPSTHEMAKTYGIAYPTAHKAMSNLVKLGYLHRRQGEGTYVAKNVKPRTRKVALAMRTKGHLFGEIAQKLFERLQEHNYSAEVIPLKSDHHITLSGLSNLRRTMEGNPHAIVSEEHTDQKYLDLIKQALSSNLPVLWIMCSEPPQGLSGHVVSCDYFEGFYGIGSYLAELGHRRIAVFALDECFSLHHPYTRSISVLKERYSGLEFLSVPSSDVTYEKPPSVIREVLCGVNRPTAVMCSLDIRAKLVLDVAKELGLRVPEDLSVTGFFDTPWSEAYNLTTVNVHVGEIADGIVYMLKELENDVCDRVMHRILIKPELIIRLSTGPPCKTA